MSLSLPSSLHSAQHTQDAKLFYPKELWKNQPQEVLNLWHQSLGYPLCLLVLCWVTLPCPGQVHFQARALHCIAVLRHLGHGFCLLHLQFSGCRGTIITWA